jgi:hypothetical protein
MSTYRPVGWGGSEYKSLKLTDDSSTDSDSDDSGSDSDDEQLFAKSNIIRKSKFKKIVHKEELLPE